MIMSFHLDRRRCGTFYGRRRLAAAFLEWFDRDSSKCACWNDCIFPAPEAVRREIFISDVDRLMPDCETVGGGIIAFTPLHLNLALESGLAMPAGRSAAQG